MRKATRVLNIINIILDILIVVLLTVLKVNYYISNTKFSSSGFNAFDLIWIGWIPVSILITLSPMLSQLASYIFVKKRKEAFAFFAPLYFLIGDYVFEFISLIGSAMSLDREWTDIAMTMMKCLCLFGIPLVLSLISFILSLKESKNNAQ